MEIKVLMTTRGSLLIGKHVESEAASGFFLFEDLMQLVPVRNGDNQGMTFVPYAQWANDNAIIPIMVHAIESISIPNPELEKAYTQSTSKLDLSAMSNVAHFKR